MQKKCSRCKQIKDHSEFHKDSNSKSGLRSDCKKCVQEQNKNKKRKKIQFTCESCKVTKTVDYYTNKRKKTNFCNNCHSKKLFSGNKRPEIAKQNSSRWKGGEYISSDGYKMVISEGEFHPSGRQKYKKEHIVVYEKHLGRTIKTQRGYNGEQVHHIDGNKLNNNLDNLILCKNTSDHKKIHCQLQEISYKLVQQGIIKFNKQTMEYYIDESRIT